MKIVIIGAGNMGGAIARCLALVPEYQVWVTNPTQEKLDALTIELPLIHVTTDNLFAAADADIIILAVKPHVVPGVLAGLKFHIDYDRQKIVSIAVGVSLDALDTMLYRGGSEKLPELFYASPDTAINVKQGMTFIASRRASRKGEEEVVKLFSNLGDTALIDELQMPAAIALSSCGIAYAYKYVQACAQAGVQLGFRPEDALKYSVATVEGAMAMLRHNKTLPQQEIDKITAPGGLTIKGINELEHTGFTSSVIRAILEPLRHRD